MGPDRADESVFGVVLTEEVPKVVGMKKIVVVSSVMVRVLISVHDGERLPLSGVPTENVYDMVGSEGIALGEVFAEVIEGAVKVGTVVEMEGWLMSGQVKPSEHGLMEQQP